MGKSFLFIFVHALSLYCVAQNVGIGTNTPAEKLDVNGNTNINGQLKFNNNAGTAGQYLVKDASNNPVWGDITEFKNMMVYDCQQIIGGGGAGNCSANWTVPAGVTKILVECWGGGGGGGNTAGGGGGGYVSARFIVSPGDIASIQTGAGGALAGPATGTAGGTSLFSINGGAIFANGGAGASTAISANFTVTLPSGGGYLVSGLTSNYRGIGGLNGNPTRESSYQVNASSFGLVRNYGDGGDAAVSPGSGAKGGYYLSTLSFSQIIYAQPSQIAGGGGAGDFTGGSNGRGGTVIIHY